MLMRICTSSEMKELDDSSEQDYGIHADLLMENAGRAAVWIMLEKFPDAGRSDEILVFAGKGNNAGDAFVVARRLICLDCKVRVFHLYDENSYQGSALKNFKILQRMNARMICLESKAELEAYFSQDPGPVTVVDGIFGTGLKGDVEGLIYDVIQSINRHASRVVSLDIPSGISGDTGLVNGTCVESDLTVSFGFPKLGHFLPPGAAHRGELVNVDISLPPHFRKEGDKFLLMRDPMRNVVEKFEAKQNPYGHKNSFGHVLCLGGSQGKEGAIAMASRACQKTGTGLVTVATWEDSLASVSAKLPVETMSVPLRLSAAHIEKEREIVNHYSALVAGPGLGTRADGSKLIEEVLMNYQGPMVLDADALNLISKYKLFDALKAVGSRTILTPHPGEMARLIGKDKEEVVTRPLDALRLAVEKTHCTVILKGASTLISSPDDVLYINHFPNQGMATGGSGDVLAGMIGGFLGQQMDPIHAAQVGVYLHSMAGEQAAADVGYRSMTATHIIENIGSAFKEIHVARERAFPEEGRAKLY